MSRIKTFTVNADSVQPGATITFKTLRRREWSEWTDPDNDKIDDGAMMLSHIISWTGIQDDNGNELPSPQESPDVIGELYMHEVQAAARLLVGGPNGEHAKN